MIHPIGLCIPECKVAPAVSPKEKLFAHVIPGKRETYIFGTDEKAYFADYAKSVFGITHMKGGWDCLRHYEILANGCIPWFPDLDKCPPQTMTHFPKALVREAMAALANTTEFNSELVHRYSRDLLEYTRQNLTTKAMARYLLGKIERRNVRRILFLSNEILPDYQRCLLLHGLKELFASECHDAPCVPHLYSDFSAEQMAGLYGGGITFTRLLDKDRHRNPLYDATVESDIADHKYDIVIYGSFHRGLPHWPLVHRYYADRDIVLICGEDLGHLSIPIPAQMTRGQAFRGDCKAYAASHDLFVRELQ